MRIVGAQLPDTQTPTGNVHRIYFTISPREAAGLRSRICGLVGAGRGSSRFFWGFVPARVAGFCAAGQGSGQFRQPQRDVVPLQERRQPQQLPTAKRPIELTDHDRVKVPARPGDRLQQGAGLRTYVPVETTGKSPDQRTPARSCRIPRWRARRYAPATGTRLSSLADTGSRPVRRTRTAASSARHNIRLGHGRGGDAQPPLEAAGC